MKQFTVALAFFTYQISYISCSLKVSVRENPINDVETGFEFLPPDGNINIQLSTRASCSHLYDGVIKNEKHDLVLSLVQTCISALKGYSEDTQISRLGGLRSSKPDWTLDPSLLKELVHIELKIYEILTEFYMQILDNEWNGSKYAIFSYLEDIDYSSNLAKTSFDSLNKHVDSPEMYIASHPNLIYRMIRRFASDLNPILDQIHKTNPEIIEVLREKANPKGYVLPTSHDLFEFLQAIGRIQKFGLISTNDFANGIFEKVHTGFSLNAIHAFEIGAYYAYRSTWDLSIEWIHLSITQIKAIPHVIENHEIVQFVLDLFTYVVGRHNSNFYHLQNNNWTPDVFNKQVQIPFEPEQYIRMTFALHDTALNLRTSKNWNWALRHNYKRVCSGENLQTEQEKKNLRCWLEQKAHPYWKINPLKVELLSEKPLVYQVYDFIGNKLIQKMQNETLSGLTRSEVIDVKTDHGSMVDSSRTSSNTWIDEGYDKGHYLQNLVKNMEFLTGLSITPEDDSFQVGNYGSSHHYDSHLDAFDDLTRTRRRGNRLTTITGYLSDVTVGGRTGFPVLGTAADPVKGSVVVWNNIEQDMYTVDGRTWHGGCPVVLGIKWIATKWVYSFNNMFKHKCPKNRDSYSLSINARTRDEL